MADNLLFPIILGVGFLSKSGLVLDISARRFGFKFCVGRYWDLVSPKAPICKVPLFLSLDLFILFPKRSLP